MLIIQKTISTNQLNFNHKSKSNSLSTCWSADSVETCWQKANNGAIHSKTKSIKKMRDQLKERKKNNFLRSYIHTFFNIIAPYRETSLPYVRKHKDYSNTWKKFYDVDWCCTFYLDNVLFIVHFDRPTQEIFLDKAWNFYIFHVSFNLANTHFFFLVPSTRYHTTNWPQMEKRD